MVKKYIQTFSKKIPIDVFFEKYYKEFPKESKKTFEVISKILEIKTLEDYKRINDYLWIHFNFHKIFIKYEELQKMKLPFDEDIIKFIAFLSGTTYFGAIGFTTIENWLNAKDLNHPHKKVEDENEGFSLMEAINYEYGQNAIRRRLLSTLKWLTSQGG
jgi:hypothetical protein